MPICFGWRWKTTFKNSLLSAGWGNPVLSLHLSLKYFNRVKSRNCISPHIVYADKPRDVKAFNCLALVRFFETTLFFCSVECLPWLSIIWLSGALFETSVKTWSSGGRTENSCTKYLKTYNVLQSQHSGLQECDVSKPHTLVFSCSLVVNDIAINL